ncbi:tetratricopeptide repeat protein [Eisenibacter elegans]|uniref:tetratricopeptide repeat protein n=1 Tax=Eisenibacter elegans TaxID=997 RepID=UPI00041F0666|nr:tetratricopeptide repeat protein [Eisenibacter elegans]
MHSSLKFHFILKTYTLSICLYLLVMPLWAQQQIRIDSLMRELEDAANGKQAQLYNALAAEYQEVQPAKAKQYALEAFKLAKKRQDRRALSDACRLIGVSALNTQNYLDALKYTYMALGLEEELRRDDNRAALLLTIAKAYKGREIYGQAIDYYIRAVELYEKLGHKKGTVEVLNDLADTYLLVARYNNAIYYAYKSLEIATLQEYPEEVKKASLTLSKIYAKVGAYQQAYDYHQLYTELKDSLLKQERLQELTLLEQNISHTQEKQRALQTEKERKIRNSNLQYLLIFIVFTALFGLLFFAGNFGIPANVIRTLLFLALFLSAQFILLLIRPSIEQYTGGLPLFMLGVNGFFALLFLYFNRSIETRLKKRVLERAARAERVRVLTRVRQQKRKRKQRLKPSSSDS